MENKRLYPLDTMRGIAAIGVAFFWHYQHFTPQNGYPFSKKAYWFYHYGWSLVELFFVLSGFIFAYMYKEKIGKKDLSFKKYTVLRITRLYPLHLMTLIIVGILQVMRYIVLNNFFIYENNDIYHFVLNLVFLQSGWFSSGFSFNGPSWSVGVEVIGYILFYILINKFFKNKGYILGYVFFLFVGIAVKKAGINSVLINEPIARMLIGFFSGCITYEIYRLIVTKAYSKRINNGCILLLGIIILCTSVFGHRILGEWLLVYTIIIYPMLILVVINTKLINDIMSIRPLVYLGEISYSIYLIHFPIQLLVQTLNQAFNWNLNYSSRITFIGFLVLTIGVSIISYERFEKPMQRYLRKKWLN